MNDTGSREQYESGAFREPQSGKPRPDLIPVEALIRWGSWMQLGATKYDDRNWERGIALTRYEASAWRHLLAYMLGDKSEDHLSGVLFNVGGIMHHEEHISKGTLPTSLDDRPGCRKL